MFRPARNALLLAAALGGLALGGLAWGGPALAGGAAAGPPPCPTTAEVLASARPLQVAARAQEHGRLSVLVLGSASVTQGGSGAAEGGWPARLGEELGARLGATEVEVTVRGGRGMSVMDHLDRLRAAPAGARPALVLWQSGTVEITRGMDVEEMADALRDGVAALRRQGADVILIDQQYSRFLRTHANLEPYREKLRLVAAAAEVALFPRYELMQAWVESGALDLERTPRDGRAAALQRLNACLGRAMAEVVVRGIAEAR